MPTSTTTRRRDRITLAAAAAAAATPWWILETTIRFADVPDHLEKQGGGRRYDLSTVYRWSTVGVYGVRLRRFRTSPRGWCTTLEELQRFAAAMTSIGGGDLI